MLAFAYFLMKATLASAILYGYYWIALRNKAFHQWNRFYLLSIPVISLLVPLVKIPVWHPAQTENNQVIQLLKVVSTGDEFVETVTRQETARFDTTLFLAIAYALVALMVFGAILFTLKKIKRLISSSPLQELGDIKFINTDAKGTPFSFFRYIFWNHKIDLQSETGQHIFNHELAHVREKHSLDKLFIQMLLIPFWANPVFWLIRRELALVHEFIADQKSVEQQDTRAFAAMILQTAFPQQHLPLTNAFFYSPIKRRLRMLTRIHHPKFSYVSRLLVLPVAALVFAAFTLKPKTLAVTGGKLSEERFITIMIDPGHGGDDNGAIAPDGTLEKDINLAIAKKIQKLNKEKNVQIILSRESDQAISVKDRVALAAKAHIDAFVSLHVNVSDKPGNENSGIEMFVSRNPQAYAGFTRLMASLISDEVGKVYPINRELKQNKNTGVWVLDAPSIHYASLLIECGYLNNPKDLAYLKSAQNQEKLAQSLLQSFSRYASAPLPKLESDNHSTSIIIHDSSAPRKMSKDVKSVDYTVDGNVVVIFKNGTARKMKIDEAEKKGYIAKAQAGGVLNIQNCLFIVDGVEMAPGYDINVLDPKSIKEINVLKNWEAAARYGEKGKNGVVLITTRDQSNKGDTLVPRKDIHS